MNLSYIQSNFSSFTYEGPAFVVDVDGSIATSEKLKQCLAELRASDFCGKVDILRAKEVPWFPTEMAHLDEVVDAAISGEGDTGLIEKDHPGFNDKEYRERRNHLAEIAVNYRYSSYWVSQKHL